MKSTLLAALVFGLAGATCLQAQITSEEARMQEDLNRLQGTWRFVSLQIEGNTIPEEAISTARIVIEGDSFVSTTAEATYAGTFRIGVTGSTKTIDMMFASGPEAGNTTFGIYRLDGDTWTICIGLASGRPRPTEFATSVGSGLALETLVRESS